MSNAYLDIFLFMLVRHRHSIEVVPKAVYVANKAEPPTKVCVTAITCPVEFFTTHSTLLRFLVTRTIRSKRPVRFRASSGRISRNSTQSPNMNISRIPTLTGMLDVKEHENIWDRSGQQLRKRAGVKLIVTLVSSSGQYFANTNNNKHNST